ncbi:MAG: hypothetical protein M0P31_11475 [Solirubrobacteraceae bacterium]|nr:hypothetical protein [Solirubrobacteraceae bacterium]
MGRTTVLHASSSRPTGRRSRRLAIAPIVLLAALAVALLWSTAALAADRDFAPRFTASDTGDIDIVGNTLLTCPTSAQGCTAARQAGVTTSSDSSSQNNAYAMRFVDVDGDPSTFNSSRAALPLPNGATVLFAGLYWGARTKAGTGGQAAANPQNRNRIKLRVPGGSGYVQLTADQLDDGSGGIYQGFKDVTALVAGAGAGTYTAADVQSSTGRDQLAGWSLVVAYRDTSEPARNLSVFDGIKSIGGGQTGTINVSGFQTPPAGAVRTRVGFVTYEGDGGIVGDSASLNGTVLSDAQHPATNFFNSRTSRDGVLRTGTDPDYPNQLGIEQSIVEANGILPNGATSATIRLTSSGDVYAPGVVTFATELYAPRIEQTKTVEDVNGGEVEQGDVLRYTVSGRNVGQDGATGFVLRDPLPADLTYVPGSIQVTPAGGGTTATVAVTDAVGDDRGEYDAVNRRVVARLGTGSDATTGGTVAVGARYQVTFRVRVAGPVPGVPDGTRIDNVATASFASQSLGTPLTADAGARTTVRSPDLTILKTGAATIVRGAPYSYSIVVRNDGAARSQGAVTVTDELPTGLSFAATSPVSGPGWACSTAGRTFTCERDDALDAGSAHPPIGLDVVVAADAPATIANTATVAGGGDGDLTNNASTASNVPASSADLAVVKTRDVADPAVGADVTYTLRVTNHGASASTGSVVTDELPAGLAFHASDDCTGAPGSSTATCAVGPLAAGASRDLTIVARPLPGTAGTALVNRVTVAGNEPDPTPGNDRSTSSVDVRPVDLRITSGISGDPATLTPGQAYTWNLDVTNLGGSNAPGTVVRFPVPDGTTLDGPAPPGCDLVAGVVTCSIGDVAPGATVPTIAIPLRVGANPPVVIDTSASVSTTENDVDPSNDVATTRTPVAASVDLGVTLTAQPGAVSAGEELRLTATVTNHGPATPQDATLTVPLPPGTTFVRADPGCALNAAGDAVVCTLDPSELDSGSSVDRTIVVRVGDDPGSSIDATATVDTSSDDTDASNDTAATAVPVVSTAGVSIEKSVSTERARPGDVVTYTLVARNAGPATARDVVIADTLPAGVTFVSADDPCVADAGATGVRCEIGALPAGDARTVTVRARVDAIAGAFDPAASHQLVAVKREVDQPLEPHSTATATATCDAGYVATDGSVRIEHVDQGAGTFADVDIRSSRQTADGRGWTATVVNHAGGRAQVKVTVVCLRERTTEADGHDHPLIVSDPVTTTRPLIAGRHEVALTCGPGQVAIAPGHAFADGGRGEIRGSYRDGVAGWRFVVDVEEADEGTFSIRCLSTTTGEADGHVHDLGLTQLPTTTVTIPGGQAPNQRDVHRLECRDGGKGIVGSTDLDDGLVSLGNDPQPVNRDFAFNNPTDGPLDARIGLLCLADRTGGEIGVRDVTNTASVTSTTPDTDLSDNVASGRFVATTGDVGAGQAPTDPTPTDRAPSAGTDQGPQGDVAPPTDQRNGSDDGASADPGRRTDGAVARPATARLLSSTLRVAGSSSRATVRVRLRCARACTGRATLRARSAVRGTSIRRGTVLGAARVRLAAGRSTSVRIVARGRIARALRAGRVTRAQLVVDTGRGARTTRSVRLVRR